MPNISDNYVLYIVASIMTISGWAIRTHFRAIALEERVKQLESRDMAQDTRIGHMDGSLGQIFIELARIGARLDAFFQRNEGKTEHN